jgi:myo-inositol-1(or 4)-monophosphatase
VSDAGSLTPELLARLERTAVELATLAGAEITTSLGHSLSVRYKTNEDDPASFADPVSEVDHNTEVLIRARLNDAFPTHGVLGEEMAATMGASDEFIWAVDPVDGTTNFVNGFPLFAASIGVLHHGRPIVGAIWCSCTHALRPGVYHGRDGACLCLDGETLNRRSNPAVRRRLAGEPHAPANAGTSWDVRKTGSAAIECAYVAAGMLSVARFERPNVWDVAGGIALVRAAGLDVYSGLPGDWRAFTSFPAGHKLSTWREGLIIGEEGPANEMIGPQ